MGELSDRFGQLMARMAKGDAELFRTVAEQNAAIRQLVGEVAAPDPAAVLSGAPPSLLPREQCQLPALKARFRTAAAAHAHLETALGPAPTRKKTWDLISETLVQGAWPAPARPAAGGSPAGGGVSREALAQMEARLARRIDQLEQRLLTALDRLLTDP